MAGKLVKCPICRKSVAWKGNPHRPFCSERCKLVDLGHWLSEDYRISVPKEILEEDRGKNQSARIED